MSWLKDYLSFSKRERNAFIGLVVILAVFIFLPDLFSSKKTAAVINEDLQKATANSRSSAERDAGDSNEWQSPFADPAPKRATRLFRFDPNTLDEEGLITLGLTERTARTIINYRNKGGKFRKPDDLRKIYSLKKDDADRIIPYVRIENAPDQYPAHYSSSKAFSPRPAISAIDINTATVEEWKSLPGIGEVLSVRIVKFRDRMGGFAMIEQVAKTYGLKDSTFRLIRPYLKLSAPAVNKIDINTARENELMECPGVTADIAQAIVIYRKQKGNFAGVHDLKKIVFINQETFERIAPCLKVE